MTNPRPSIETLLGEVAAYMRGELSPAHALLLFQDLLATPELLVICHPSVREAAQELQKQQVIGGTRH